MGGRDGEEKCGNLLIYLFFQVPVQEQRCPVRERFDPSGCEERISTESGPHRFVLRQQDAESAAELCAAVALAGGEVAAVERTNEASGAGVGGGCADPAVVHG